MGAQKNRLDETVLLTTQKHMFRLMDKKIMVFLRLKGLTGPMPYIEWYPFKSRKAMLKFLFDHTTKTFLNSLTMMKRSIVLLLFAVFITFHQSYF